MTALESNQAGVVASRDILLQEPISSHLAFHPTGRVAYRASTSFDSSLYLVRTYSVGSLTLEQQGEPLVFTSPVYRILVAPTGRAMYVSVPGGVTVIRLDPETGAVGETVGTYAVGGSISDGPLTISADGQWLFVTDKLHRLDPTSGAVIGLSRVHWPPNMNSGQGVESNWTMQPQGRWLAFARGIPGGNADQFSPPSTLNLVRFDQATGQMTPGAAFQVSFPYQLRQAVFGNNDILMIAEARVATGNSNDRRFNTYLIRQPFDTATGSLGLAGTQVLIEGLSATDSDSIGSIHLDPNGRTLLVCMARSYLVYAIAEDGRAAPTLLVSRARDEPGPCALGR